MENTQTATQNVRLPRDLIEQLRAIADRNERSLAAELRVAVKRYVEDNSHKREEHS